MGAESLPPSTVEYMYRWNRNGDSSTLSSSPTLIFTPLTRSDDGTYTCTVTITSPLLNNTRTAMSGRTLTVTDPNFPRVLVMVNAVIITSSSATIQWSFPRLLKMRNEIVSIFYGTASEQLGAIIYPIPSDPNMEQYSIQLMSLQPSTRYFYQIYSSNKFANRTDGVVYAFKTDDSSELAIYNVPLAC